jgi:hypothetical protein
VRFSTDDGQFELVVSPRPGRGMFAFQLVIDGHVVGDADPAILGSLMWELQHRPSFDADQVPDARVSPAAAVELLLADEQLESAMLRGAESLDRWLVWLYRQQEHGIALAQAADGDERAGPVLVSVVEVADFRDVLDSAVRYWSEVARPDEDVPAEVVRGPEPGWELAAAVDQGTKRNPAWQDSLWDCAARGLQLVAGLSPSLDALAARLRLHTERSWEDPLGEVDAAMFSIGKIHFALSHNDGHPTSGTKVWVSRDQADVGAALDVLLSALGIGRNAFTYCLDPATGIFVDLRPGAGG